MKIKLFNTLTRKKEDFVPIDSKEVGLYSCGPTVYHYVHIGNLRSYIFADVLKRVLKFNNFKVKHVMNITDVGHLTSDGDTGEDKMLKGAKREGKTVWEVAKHYTDSFLSDAKKLNFIMPDVLCKATGHISEQIEQIKKLEKNGFTYVSGGNVYFDTSKSDDYGALARLSLNSEKKSRVESDKNKKNSNDFVLWFTKSKFQDQEMKWDSPWGTGYPGWHIECSAMASKYLGEQFDIHTGGQDLSYVHHPNEIAQAQGAYGKLPWVKYWLHNEFIVLDRGEKMSKSDDNFLQLTTLEKKGFDPLDYRFFCLGGIYRNPLTFSFESLRSSQTARKKLQDKVWALREEIDDKLSIEKLNLESLSKNSQTYLDSFTNFINDDLNLPRAVALCWDLLKDSNVNATEKLSLLFKFDSVLGISLNQEKKIEHISQEIIDLAEKREVARKEKDWAAADILRDEIVKQGYNLSDSKTGYSLSKIV